MNHQTLQFMGAWSFGQSHRPQLKGSSEQFPGPGTYNPKLSKSYSGWTQSKDDRISTFIKDGLGSAVGTYHPNESSVFPRSVKYSIGGENRIKPSKSLTRETNHTPSTQLTKLQAPYYSFGYVPDPLNNFKTPAPGHYSSQRSKSEFNRSQNYFTKGMRELDKKQAPGVGEYDVRQNQTPGPSYRIGVPRDSVMKNESADKFYTIGGDMKSYQRGKSLGSRCMKSSILIPNDSPGPGAHDPNVIPSKNRILDLKAQRVPIVPEQAKYVPGPGTYDKIGLEDISETTKGGIGFTKSKRPENLNTINPSFVGRYEAPSSLRSVLGKISQKIRRSLADETPGPSSYTPQHLLAKTRRSLTMYSNRVDFSRSDTKHIGPGQYQSSKGMKSQFGTMGRSTRDKPPNSNPGPGEYDISNTIGRIPKYFKNLNKKIDDDGSTKVIMYSPAKTKEIRLKTTANTFSNLRNEEEK